MLWVPLTASMRAVLGHGEYTIFMHIIAVGFMRATVRARSNARMGQEWVAAVGAGRGTSA